jgi:hypothetical protein
MVSHKFSGKSSHVDKPRNVMRNTCVLYVTISSQWKRWRRNCDVSATFKRTNKYGLAHVGDTADLNLESVASEASEGPGSVYAEGPSHLTLGQFGRVYRTLPFQNVGT